jgi:hypothetical protein
VGVGNDERAGATRAELATWRSSKSSGCSSMRPGIVLYPPLVVSEGEVDELVRRLRLTLEDTWDWVRGTF